MKKKYMVLAHLKSGKSITGMQAIDLFDYYRLSDGILKLREAGYKIETRMLKNPKTGTRYGEYHMTEKVNA